MKAVMVMYDTLRLDYLPSYGGHQIELPNFSRLAKRSVQFDNSYVCSLPCMPARREIHTGRPNFTHREWGPLEPFDDSMPELLRSNGIYARIVTDHNHYVEDGGGTYLTRYSSWECNRGQEGDPWQGNADQSVTANPHTLVKLDLDRMPKAMSGIIGRMYREDMNNRKTFTDAENFPQGKTFAQGLDFIDNNYQLDNWFLQIETFDPHEPFTAPDDYVSRLFDPDHMSDLDWPPYAKVTEPQEVVDTIRKKYMALLAFCDENLGRVLDAFDRYDLWKDTMLIVNTDHGFLLGEHDWWAKGGMPEYQEIAHTPLFIWDPRCGKTQERRQALVQTIDLAPTLLDYFGLEIPKDMTGKSLKDTIDHDAPIREYGIFGNHCDSMNVTDGRYVLMLAPKPDVQMYNYTLMTTHMRYRFTPQELENATLAEPFDFTKNCPVLKVPTRNSKIDVLSDKGYLLYDVADDPKQLNPLEDEAVLRRMKEGLVSVLKECDTPSEVYECYGLV